MLMFFSINTAYAGSSTGQLHVSAQAVATLSFRLIDEPHYYHIGDRYRDKQHDEDEGQEEKRKEAGHKKEGHDFTIKKSLKLAVTSNSRAGYAMVLEAIDSGPYRMARIRIEGRNDIELHAGQLAQVPFRGFQSSKNIRMLKVKLTIPSDARAGTYLWPIRVSVVPL